MKKTLSLLLAIVMVLSMLPISVFATEAGPKITFTTDFTNEMEKGNTFTVTATLEGNTGLASFANQLKWNPNVVEFLGFKEVYDEDEEGYIMYTEVFSQTGWLIETNLNGSFLAARTNDRTKNGILYVGEFKIIAEDGALGLGLATTEVGQKYAFADSNGNTTMPELDFSKISGLTVGGKPVGPEMPENAPFTAITTDAGAIVDVEDCGLLAVDPWGGYPVEVPYYHITIPADATEAYIRFDMPSSDFQSQSAADGTPVIGSAWAGVNDEGSGMAGLKFEDNSDHTIVIIPLEFNADPWGAGDMKSTVKTADEDELYYAVGPEDSSAAVIAVFSLEFASEDGEEEDIYSITIDKNIVGGTVTVIDENQEEINKAKEGASICLKYEAKEGYRFKHYLINGNVVTEAELGMYNGFYQMPAENITVSAVFEEEGPEIEPNPITEIEISHPNIVIDETTDTMTMNMVAGASEQIDMSFAVADAELESSQIVFWSSSDEEVATVDQNGKINALKGGSTTITAKAVEASGIALLADGEDVLAQFTLTVADPAAGYAVNMGADAEVDANETIQIPVTVTHSDSNVTDYKSFEFTFQYDPTVLTLKNESSAAEGKDITIVNENGTITVRRYGNALKVGDAAITLEFTAKKTGNTNVKLTSAKVGTTADARGENIPTAQIVDNLTKITVSSYTVKLPDEFDGESVSVPGEDYTFTAKDLNYNYTITATIGNQTLTVTGSGTEADPYKITADQITGNIEITTEKSGKQFEITLNGESLAHEDGFTTEGEKTYVQYMTAYTAKLTKKDHYIYDLKVTVNGETIAHDYNGETGIITIAGNLITGPVVIESGEKESDKHNVEFEGAYASHAKYEGELGVYNGESFSFTIETPAGLVIESYQVSYKLGDAEEYTTLEANDGTYTVEKVTAALTIKIEGTSDLKVEVNEYVKLNGKTVFLVTATQTLPEGKNLAYNTKVMYLKNFQVEGETVQQYAFLVMVESGTLTVEDASAQISVVEAASTVLEDTFNVNESSALDINDAQLVYDLYNNVYQDIDTVGMKKFLRADVNGSRNINVADAAAVVDAILANNQ